MTNLTKRGKKETMNPEYEEKQFIKTEKIKQEFDEYRKFAYKKNFFVMGLAIVLATQTQKFASSLTEYLIMPVINWVILATNGNWRNLVFTPISGMDIEIGKLIQSFIEFTIITVILYFIFQKIVRKIDPEVELEVPHVNHLSQKHK
jgi:large-conductance mechanosensitive channel